MGKRALEALADYPDLVDLPQRRGAPVGVFLTLSDCAMLAPVLRWAEREARRSGRRLSATQLALMGRIDVAERHHVELANLVTTREAARLLGVSSRRVRRQIETGRLDAVLTPRGWLIPKGAVARPRKAPRDASPAARDMPARVPGRRHQHLVEWRDPTGDDAVGKAEDDH